jgi:chromosome segregation ATPase
MLVFMCGRCLWLCLLNTKMGKGGRAKTQNGNNSSSSIALCNDNGKDQKKIFQSTEDKDKDDQISQPCNRCEDEISNLRKLNQILIKDINTSRQDFQTCFLHKVAEMESQIHILQAASTNFGSKMNNQFIQQVKIGEQLSDHLIEIDKEFRQEIAKRDEEYDAGISKAWQHLQEAEERFKREISEKEEYCRAVVSDKQTLETSVLQLTDKIKVAEQAWNADKENLFSSLGSTYEKKIEDMSALNQRVLLEKTELESQLNESKERTRVLLEKLEDDRHLWVSEKQNLRGNVAELQTKNFSMATERGFLYQKNTALRAEVESLKAQLNDNITRIAQMQDERVQNERVLQQYRTENIEKEEYCRAVVSDKQTLETSVLQLTDKIKVISAEFEAARKAWESEKDGLFSQIVEARKKAEEIAESSLIAEQAWNADKDNRLSSLGSTYEKKIEDMAALNQRDLLEKTELESQLNESKERTRALLEKLEDDRHLWVSEKQNLRGNVAELQTKNFSMATERGFLCQKNTALRAEVESLKAQLNDNITRLAQMQDERVQNERVLQQYRTENIEKEEYCRAVVSDKQTLETSVLQLTDKIKVISAEFEAARKAWESEKDGLFSQIVEARKEAEEIAESSLIAEQAWTADKENLLSSLGRTYEKKIEDMSDLNQRVLVEKIELESQLNESKERTRALLEKLEDDRHLWVSEKQNLRGNVAELQTKNFSMATERGFLYQKNTALRAEVESLKAQLNDNIAGLAQMQDERVQNERVLQQYRTENIEKEGYCRALVSDKRTLETRVLQLTDKSKVISAEFEAARKAWELERMGFSHRL